MQGFGWTLVAAACANLAAASVCSSVHMERRAEHTGRLASKKARALPEALPFLGTLVDIHTGEHVPLDSENPSAQEIDRLLADRVTGAREHLDPRLLELLRDLARRTPGARFEIVSGYRSPKLNEMLRKKGHHVASYSQHSLGRAVDFRMVLPEGPEGGIGPPVGRKPVDPLVLEEEIRKLGWSGGTGVYLSETDRFVHADVGSNRRWVGL
jgi:uncharacterized protein YcbK (DUF882 family)